MLISPNSFIISNNLAGHSWTTVSSKTAQATSRSCWYCFLALSTNYWNFWVVIAVNSVLRLIVLARSIQLTKLVGSWSHTQCFVYEHFCKGIEALTFRPAEFRSWQEIFSSFSAICRDETTNSTLFSFTVIWDKNLILVIYCSRWIQNQNQHFLRLIPSQLFAAEIAWAPFGLLFRRA